MWAKIAPAPHNPVVLSRASGGFLTHIHWSYSSDLQVSRTCFLNSSLLSSIWPCPACLDFPRCPLYLCNSGRPLGHNCLCSSLRISLQVNWCNGSTYLVYSLLWGHCPVLSDVQCLKIMDAYILSGLHFVASLRMLNHPLDFASFSRLHLLQHSAYTKDRLRGSNDVIRTSLGSALASFSGVLWYLQPLFKALQCKASRKNCASCASQARSQQESDCLPLAGFGYLSFP